MLCYKNTAAHAQWVFPSALLLLLVSCSGVSNEEPPDSPDVHFVNVAFGPTVTNAARTHVVTVASVAGSTRLGNTTKLSVPRDSASALVLALNAEEEPLFAALSTSATGSELVFDAESTAISAVRVPLALLPVESSRLGTLDITIRQHPDFPRLTQLLRGLSEQGISYLNSDEAMQLVAHVATDIGRGVSVPPTEQERLTPPSSFAAGGVSFSFLPLALEDALGSADITAIGKSSIPLAVTVFDDRGQAVAPTTVLNGREIKSLPGAPGELLVRAGQTDESRRLYGLGLASDIFSGLTFAIGLPLEREEVAALLWKLHAGLLNPQRVADIANASPAQAAVLVIGALWEARDPIASLVYDRLVKKYGANVVAKVITKVALKNALKVISAFEFAQLLVERVPHYIAWSRYRNVQEDVRLCQPSGTFRTIDGVFNGTMVLSGSASGAPLGCVFTFGANIAQDRLLFVGDTTGADQVGCETTDYRIEFYPLTQTIQGNVEGCRVAFGYGPYHYAGRLTDSGFEVRSTATWYPGPYALDAMITAVRTGDRSQRNLPAASAPRGMSTQMPPVLSIVPLTQ